MARDPHRFVNELDAEAVDRLISRLESRAKDRVFINLVEKYITHLQHPSAPRLLEVGCGTGVVVRSLARRDGFHEEIVGVDQSAAFIDAARRFADQEGVADRVKFDLGDAHALDFPTASFDVVIANTLISHATAPQDVLREMARVVRPGGTIVVFDGDYASLTYAYPDYAFGRRMDDALATATFNNPTVMRDMPRWLPEMGLKLKTAWGDAVVEVGKASYFQSFADAYVPYVIKAGVLPEHEIEAWYDAQREAMKAGTFFASCNYYCYLIGHQDA